MGCIARLGCLVLIVILGVGAWFTRAMWLPERYRPHSAVAEASWQPLSSDGAERTRAALDKLSQPGGQAFETLSANDLASFAVRELTTGLGDAADSLRVSASGDRVSMRASVRMAELRQSGALGALGSLLGDREPVELTGTFRVLKPGIAEFDVLDARLRNVSLPRGVIPTLMRRMGGIRPEGLPANALALPIPRYIGDIRVSNGKVTLYKSVQ